MDAGYSSVAANLGIQKWQVEALATLFASGATVPFVARYRKESHGNLDELAILSVQEHLARYAELQARKKTIVASLEERELLTSALAEAIAACTDMAKLEDIYLPYRPKRRTRAILAKEAGLEPLADKIFQQERNSTPLQLAVPFINQDKGIADAEAALAGARDIIAERLSEDRVVRERIRQIFYKAAVLCSRVVKGKEEEGRKYADYFDWSESAFKAAGHRILAVLRGEREKVLQVSILPDEGIAVQSLLAYAVHNASPAGEQVRIAALDAYRRLLAPSLQTEIRNSLRERAENEAIGVFSQNLRHLLLAAPLGEKRIMAIDPGYRTGGKLVFLNAQGRLLHHDVIYLLSEKQKKEAIEKVHALCKKFAPDAVAIGNGTASRETEAFVRSLELGIPVVMVNESGASIYSASAAARREFPDLDVTVRGAISIGRRLMDPLAELVKIPPESIGVGQYQHDVTAKALQQRLGEVVVSCVASVGVEVNTASVELLANVAGLGPALAQNLFSYREEHGPLTSRTELRKVPRLGPKAFEQVAGFLRIRGGRHPLDASAVHPERYALVERMAQDMGVTVAQLLADANIRQNIRLEQYISDDVGLPTLHDIMAELEKPGRDPRDVFVPFAFAEHISDIDDLVVGMRLPGIVTNVTNFGAFVDIGIGQDGLIHISQLADVFVRNPHDVVAVQQHVTVTVLQIDKQRKRISLSLRSSEGQGA